MVKVENTLKVIDMREAERLGMELDTWNIFMFAEHEGETYVFDFDPSCAQDIDDDVTNLKEEWHWMVKEARKQYLRNEIKGVKQSMEHAGYGMKDLRYLHSLENELEDLE
tara:strand:+ start:387 stop:716 length:330 start_codon:yes stop_codon:yes gene_type:complete